MNFFTPIGRIADAKLRACKDAGKKVHFTPVQLSKGLHRVLLTLARRKNKSVGEYVARLVAEHVRNVDIGRKYVPAVPASMFVDEGGGP